MNDISLDIILVTSNYPYEGHPNVGTFVAALAEAWARQGDAVRVIAPLPIYTARTGEFVWRHPSSHGPLEPTVVHPGFMSYSNRQLGPISTTAWTARSFCKAILKAGTRHQRRPDVVYSHFLSPAGVAGAELASRLERPSIVALGESGWDLAEEALTPVQFGEAVRSFDGILSVSESNARTMIERYGADESRITVVPNAADTERFQPHDQLEARRHLGLPEDATILSFTGYFIDRKGPLRVVEAMERVPNLYGVFLGDGPDRPTGERVLHAGRVRHDEVALWLSASDFFVLPTLAEGSPNAVIEAMACGLPIVSSDLPSLRETVDRESALLVDPMDISALADALAEISTNSTKRYAMGVAAIERGRRTNLDARASRIREWIRDVVQRFERENG